jgi:Sel1 repeat
MFLRKCEQYGGGLSNPVAAVSSRSAPVRATAIPASPHATDARTNPALILGLVAVCLLVGVLFVTLKSKRQAPDAAPEVTEVINPEALKARAEGGDAEAQMKLGAAYAKGEVVKLDYTQAAKWYRQAADQGHAGAQNALGELYEAGQGVTRDATEAAKWYRRAAEQGLAAGQYGLAVMYLTGNGVPKDDAEALKWYRQSADQGYALAIFHLGMRYKKGQGVTQDPVEAYKWLSLAAARGIAEATEIRDELKRSMTREQVAEGKRREEAFVEKKPAPPAV